MKKVLAFIVVLIVFRCENYEKPKQRKMRLKQIEQIEYNRKRKPRDRDWEISYSC